MSEENDTSQLLELRLSEIYGVTMQVLEKPRQLKIDANLDALNHER